MRRLLSLLFLSSSLIVSLGSTPASNAQEPGRATTAWSNGVFHLNTAGVVGRSDIVLGRPNADPTEALPLGNGRLGAAIWSADGMTIQLNRADTLPHRLSPGQVVIPGLARLINAPDYSGRLDLYNGAFIERGGGMTATVYVQPHTDTLIIDVTGADPQRPQTAVLRLWEPRTPAVSARGNIGTLTESWLDDREPGASGARFGSLSAITATGDTVSAAITDRHSVTVTLTPGANGRFRIFIAAPHYSGAGSPYATAMRALADRSSVAHAQWWHAFWQRAALIRVTSADGAGDYMENLRNIFLFSAAAENGDRFPGSQAGVGDLFSSTRDDHKWDPSAYWHWNLRMQVAAHLSAGLPELNLPYFRLYRENLQAIEQWTRQRVGGRPGACVPETMRFNGKGIEYETWGPDAKQPTGLNCDAASKPYYNARTLSTGAEVSLWIWQQYLLTNDRAFLAQNFPVMEAAARFLLAYEKPGPDGLNHTSPSNAHETQWDVLDPTTDLSARKALYTATVQAAATLRAAPQLVESLQAAIVKIPELPRIQVGGRHALLPSDADGHGEDMIAESYEPNAEIHNVENIGLEPVWPYSLIGDTSPLFSLAQRTFAHRPNKGGIDWSFDPLQAARLHLPDEAAATMIEITQANQRYINGFARWGGEGKEFYVEQSGVVAATLPELLVQDYDGLIRFAPSVPNGWEMDGVVPVRDGSRAMVQVRGGTIITAGITTQRSQTIRVRNPWPGHRVRVVDASTHHVVQQTGQGGDVISVPVLAHHSYLIERTDEKESYPFAPVDGQPANTYRRMGTVQIGLAPR